MTNHTENLFKKTLLSINNINVVTFLILAVLTSCTNTTESNKEKPTVTSVVENGVSNNNPESPNGDVDLEEVYQNAEKMPEFIGGIKKFRDFLSNNLVYPEWEKAQKIEGNVFVTFIIEKDGSVSTLKVVRAPFGSKNLSDEAVRVLRLMPKWIPGEIEGEKVRVSYTLPIMFKL